MIVAKESIKPRVPSCLVFFARRRDHIPLMCLHHQVHDHACHQDTMRLRIHMIYQACDEPLRRYHNCVVSSILHLHHDGMKTIIGTFLSEKN